MAKILIDRSVVEQALEAMVWFQELDAAREPLRAALEQQVLSSLKQPEQEPVRPIPHLAKPFGGVLPWGENPTDETKIWFSFRGPDGFIWQDGQWVWVAPTVISDLRAPPATSKEQRRLADSMRRVFGGVAQEQADVPEAGFGEPVTWAEEIIADLHALRNSELICEADSGDALIRLEAAIATIEEAAQRYTAPTQRKPVEPVDGDVLPAVGSTVWIRHGRDADAHACTVTGYYVWDDLGGNKNLHRVFVRLVYAGTGREQARMLKDCFATKEAALAHGINGETK